MSCDLFSLLPSVVILDGRGDDGVNLCVRHVDLPLSDRVEDFLLSS